MKTIFFILGLTVSLFAQYTGWGRGASQSWVTSNFAAKPNVLADSLNLDSGVLTFSPSLHFMRLVTSNSAIWPYFEVSGGGVNRIILGKPGAGDRIYIEAKQSTTTLWNFGAPDASNAGDGTQIFFGKNATGINPTLWIDPTARDVGINTTTPNHTFAIEDDGGNGQWSFKITANKLEFYFDNVLRFSVDTLGVATDEYP